VAHRRLPIRTPRSVPLAGAAAPADAPHSTSGPPATVPNDADRSTDSTSNSEPPIERPTSQPGTTTPSQVAESEPPLQLSTQSHLPPRPETGGMPNELVHRGDSPRYAERAVSVPVTPRSDVTPRQVPAPQPMGERPLIQLLTLGLLISMIVLVSAAVGLLVGRWLTQR
jgi:hypothetical protein